MKILQRIQKSLFSTMRIVNSFDVSLWKKIFLVYDIIYCVTCMHCTYDEYVIYEFYKYKNIYRKNFILMHHKKTDYRKINPYHFTMHKKIIYKLISRGIRREMLYLPEAGEEAFLSFVKKYKKVIVKPDVGSRGRGIQLFEYTDDDTAHVFFKSLKEEAVCEEYIFQHDKMCSLNPNCVNSVRIVALCDENEVNIIAASLKVGGKENSIVDNMHNNGIGANVDIETGIVDGVGYDYNNHTYIFHPITGTQIVGFLVPFWAETLELVKNTHLDIPQCPLLGWDVAITESGPEIIEINGAPGPKLMQLMDQKPKGKFLKDYINKHGLKKEKVEVQY